MMSSTFGAPFGGTMRDGQYGVESLAWRSILSLNFCGGAGSWLPGMVMVAAGEPGGGAACFGCCASADADNADAASNAANVFRTIITTPPSNNAVQRE